MKPFIVATIGLALAVPSVAMAAPSPDAWYAQSVQTGLRAIDSTVPVEAHVRPAFVPLNVRVQPGVTPTFFANFVASGLNAANVPCFNCVLGTPGTFGLPAPFNYVTTGSYWQYNISWTNLTYSGSCTASYAVAAGKTSISKNSVKLNVSGEGAYDWGWVANPITYSGPAVLTGKVACGGKISAVHATIIFQ
jgi:hypothetical protein